MNSCPIMFSNESMLMVSKQYHSTEGMIPNSELSLMVSKHNSTEGPSRSPQQQLSLMVPKHNSTEGPSRSPQQPLSRYESQKRRDWNTFGQYLKNQKPQVPLSQCNFNHVLDFLRYLDQFGKTKVHLHSCIFFGQPDPPSPCTCPLRQAWGSLDALIGRLRAAYEENGGSSEANPFGNGVIRVYLRDVKESQAKARGVPYKKTKKRKKRVSIHKPLDDVDLVELS